VSAIDFLIKGVVLGFSIAAPVGPIGLLCIRRSLAEGALTGFASGLGAATADAVYGALAGFGVRIITDALVGWQDAFRLVGGLVLLWLAWSTARARPAERAADAAPSRGLLGAYGSTLALTLTNPATILSFAAVFGGLGMAEGDTGAALALVGGVFTGSALWWLGLSSGVSRLRGRLTPAAMVWINRGSGAVLGAFGLVALASLAG
jgi:threonine/homoserine/homoserine lactone efflux protein